MLNKLYKYFFYLFLTLLILTSLTITFNSTIRSKLLGSLVSGYKVYMIASLQVDLKREKTDIENANKKLLRYLRHNDILANGKSKILIGIYDATRLVQSKANTVDYIKLEGVFKRLLDIDPTLYEANLWYAKSLFYKQEYAESLEIIDKGIKISPADHDLYRLGINVAKKINDKKLVEKYCNQYFLSQFGGKESRYKGTHFTGFNLNNFAVSFENKSKDEKLKEKKFIHSGIALNKFANYEIIPSTPLDINGISIFFSLLKGTAIQITEIQIFSENNKYLQTDNDFFISSRNSFFFNQVNKKILISAAENDEILNIDFDKTFPKVDKILIKMKISKLSLNNTLCNNHEKNN